ncbi:30S ribosomal protein S1, chloroplastic [Auxenochlorella protothecoides]|uniref:30S ribosomal protein S1, chloroplastic n=1 Tax=Auxenochlorella protothecoides TaxID=3075 RepID=A0A087SFX1_AUXPR|nr:30S ribosomal protein S1, chloroplastic [Auxenochlorella protothecoides]KFM24625.1 30S ribosomal protein S1, chloroplastic [Auxenochlorella protothecoides]
MRLQAAPRNNKGERRPTDLELYNGLWLGQTVLGRVVKALPTPEAVTGNPNNTAGPLLSAFLHDRRTMWHRGWQLQSCNREDRENVMMRVEGVNGGGLVSRVCGLPIFVPYSQLHKDRDLRYSEEELRERYLGKDIEVAVIEVDMRSQKLVASVSRGLSNSIMRKFHVGHLVEGMVRRIDRNGVFIGIKDTMETGLLHISNVSRKHVPDVSEVFSVGEMVWVMVMGFEPGFGKVSFSTAELEVEDGDIMTNKELCWENRGEWLV